MSTNNQTDDKPKLSNEQKQKMKKYAVFALMSIICAGCMWFIFAPSAEDKAKQDMQTGFNAEIPDPKNEGIVGDKATAYEQEQVKQKQAERMRSLDDFSSLLGENGKKPADDLALLPDEPAKSGSGISSSTPKPTAVQNSVNAYRDINRNLGNFYESPKNDPEKERLQQELNDLKNRMDETENRKNAVDEQMALMEKSFQMAAKYMPGTTGSVGTQGTVATNANAVTNTSGKTLVVPVSGVVEQTVSALPQELSGKEVMQAFAQPRNMGFYTATAELAKERKNTISACIHSDQTVMDGESVRLRLLEPMRAGKMFVRENTILSGFSKIQGERLQITITSMEYGGNILPVEMSVYDTDGQRGIFIPNTKEINAVKEVAANMGTNAGTSISLSSDAGEQFAADMGRSAIQGISQFFSKKMREVKVNLKAGYHVFLLPEGNINNQQLANN
ncbi:conjugative transposon protein TraM [Bacteroidia bacterium]|nr:conjugative transposon protein TraM [Bacteroidia bacterium]GHT03183.1 conjugative transposon protein TraM [Bacteroidia bacterium]GHT44999.1 conjugative transposon protein TraM [Bacteroidia bacterium]